MTGATGSSLQTRALTTANAAFGWLRTHPLVWSGAMLLGALILFITFQMSIVPGMGLWIDELFSLWAGSPQLSFGEAFATRILPDTNGPTYFSLVYLAQMTGLEGRTAFIVLNFIVIGALLATILVRGWQTRMSATALVSVAVTLASAPLLVYAPEGRVYGPAMALCAALAFAACSALSRNEARKGDLILVAVLAVLAAWMHVFAAIFSGALAAGLLAAGWLVSRRRDIVILGLVTGGATTLAFLVWMAFAFRLFSGTTAWITFTPAVVFDSIWQMKQYLIGPLPGLVIAFALVGLSLIPKHSRAIALVLAITGVLFIAIPLAVSFKMPMFLARYLLVGGPALLVLFVFLTRSHLMADAAPRLWRSALGALGVLFFVFPLMQAVPVASGQFATRSDWRGNEAVLPAIANCPAGEIRAHSTVQLTFGFDHYLKGRLKPLLTEDAPVRDVSQIDCPVYGWAEHVIDDPLGLDWYQTADVAHVLGQMKLTNTTGIPLKVIRHRGGVVLARKPAAN